MKYLSLKDTILKEVKDMNPAEDKPLTKVLDKVANDNWIQTYTGRKVYPFGPFGPEDVDIRDIAHSLAYQCRWRGHFDLSFAPMKFYSIAEHSVLVSEEVSEASALDGLLHDAAEAYLGDTPTSLKELVPGLVSAENMIMLAIMKKFGLPYMYPWDEVKKADFLLRISEIEQLMPDPQMLLGSRWGKECGGHNYRVKLHCWSPETAEKVFLQRFEELKS